MSKQMTFDFKKEYKEFYMPKNKPQIVTIPKANNLHTFNAQAARSFVITA